MARDKTVADVLARQLESLASLVRNMLIDNPNLKAKDWNTEPYYFREYPRTSQFVREVLAGQANTILDRVDTIQGIVADMTGDIDLYLPDQRLMSKAEPALDAELLEALTSLWAVVEKGASYEDSHAIAGRVKTVLAKATGEAA
ncbi:hypothetical protein TA3x_000405 [Tundrisphaera sp. TA3]|uniref:hypothetical protein n=1 Tax=Tundrisphaera sp. TA3 TaxID=3435775 RepID=UPI003EB80622